MMSLDELKKLAREAEYGKSDLRVHPATTLELCALLEKAEEALLSEDAQTMEGLRCAVSIEALAAIKQWKGERVNQCECAACNQKKPKPATGEDAAIYQQISDNFWRDRNMNPVATTAANFNANETGYMTAHIAMPYKTELYTADQLRQAQAQALREAAEYFKSVTWHNVDAKLQRMADTIEKEMK